MHKWILFSLITATFSLVTTPRTWASSDHDHGTADMTIVVDSGGDLAIDYPVDERPTVRVAPAALPGVFSSTSPGFVPGEGDGVDEFELNVPTAIEVELVRTEGGVTYTQNSVTLSNPGDTVVIGQHTCQIDVDSICEGGGNDGSVCLGNGDCTLGGTCTGTCEPDSSELHTHGEFFLNLMTPDHHTFGEGSLTIRLNEGADTSNGYGSSQEFTLKVSNGHLPELELDPNDPASAKNADKCRKSVVKEVRGLISKQYQRMGKCLDAIFAAEELGKSEALAVKSCDVESPACDGGINGGNFCRKDSECPGASCAGNTKSLSANVRYLIEKSVAKLDKACDKAVAGSFAPLSESNVRTHIGMASCRTQELVGASYSNSIDEMVEVLSGCDENFCVAGPNKGAACAPDRCEGGANDGDPCAVDGDCPGGECDPADDCDAEAVEEAVIAAFPCLEMSQLEEED